MIDIKTPLSKMTIHFDENTNTVFKLDNGATVPIRAETYELNSNSHFETPEVCYSKKRKLELITVVLSYQCNMKCKYCSVQNDNANDKIDIELLLKYITRENNEGYINQNRIQIQFYGGEPLLHIDTIKRIVKHMEVLGVKTSYSLTTNGVLLTDEILNYFVKHSFFVTISLDGPSSIQDRYRVPKTGKPNSAIVIENVRKIKARHSSWMRSSFMVNSVLTPELSLHSRLKYFITLGISKVEFSLLSHDSISRLNIDINAYYKYAFTEFVELSRYIIDKLVLEEYEAIIAYPHGQYFDIFKMKNRNNRKRLCGFGNNRIAILPSGSIVPCLQFASYDNLYSMFSIGHIQSGIDIHSAISIQKEFIEAAQRCSTCPLLHICSRVCPYYILVEKNQNGQKYLCEFEERLLSLYIAS